MFANWSTDCYSCKWYHQTSSDIRTHLNVLVLVQRSWMVHASTGQMRDCSSYEGKVCKNCECCFTISQLCFQFWYIDGDLYTDECKTSNWVQSLWEQGIFWLYLNKTFSEYHFILFILMYGSWFSRILKARATLDCLLSSSFFREEFKVFHRINYYYHNYMRFVSFKINVIMRQQNCNSGLGLWICLISVYVI